MGGMLAYNLFFYIQVIEFYTPEELAKLVDLQLRDEGTEDDATVAELCKTILKYSVHTRECMGVHGVYCAWYSVETYMVYACCSCMNLRIPRGSAQQF